jgi:hypothetical protein
MGKVWVGLGFMGIMRGTLRYSGVHTSSAYHGQVKVNAAWDGMFVKGDGRWVKFASLLNACGVLAECLRCEEQSEVLKT